MGEKSCIYNQMSGIWGCKAFYAGVDAPDTVLLLETKLLAFALTKLLFLLYVVIHHLLMMILNIY